MLLNKGPEAQPEPLAERVQQLIGNRTTVQLFEHLGGFTARLNRQEISSLKASGMVLAIADDDRTMSLEAAGRKKRGRKKKKKKKSTGDQNSLTRISAIDSGGSESSSSDILPWGTKLVLGNRDPSSMIERARSKYVFVMDTGISSTTGDLNVRTEWGYNFISPGSSAEDDNGHGTHLAGTIGALANNIGIVGIAPGVNLIPYKVLDKNGSGSLSTVVAAINRMLDTIASQQLNPRDVVVNLSFGTRGQDPIIQAAISKAAALGVRFAIAAGNYGNDVDGGDGSSPFIPASYGNAQAGVFVTSAINSSLQMAGFSNYDRISNPGDIDNIGFAAPGENILSWHRRADGSFGLFYLSGSSMAAAHLSGLLLLGEISAGPMASANGAIAPDPIAMLAAAPI
ncbi:MAG: S8 family serine peptidase [Prochlorococcaceae cyanobacterium]